jgi:probable rRNA maturation factor
VPVDIRCEGVEHPTDKVVLDAEQALVVLRLETAELSVILCDDAFIHPLNRDHRGTDRPTDVLSFGQGPAGAILSADDLPQDGPPLVLGDVIISVPTAARQAAERGHTLEYELRILVVHGICHLLGHDHERDSEAVHMQAQERAILAHL